MYAVILSYVFVFSTSEAPADSVPEQPSLTVESVEQSSPATDISQTLSGAGWDAPDEAIQLDRLEASRLYQALADSEDYQEALDIAELAYQMTLQEYPEDHPEVIPVAVNLGQAYLDMEQPLKAREHFEQGVRLIEHHQGIFSNSLVGPVMGIGYSYQDGGDHDRAIRQFQRAQHVVHRNTGVTSLEQAQAIDAMTESMMAQDRWNEAENMKLLGYKIHRRHFGQDHPGVVPEMNRLATWYRDIQDFRQSRLISKKALEIQQAALGEEHPDMIPTLQGLAAAYLEERGPRHLEKGLEAHQQIVSIADQNPQLGLEARVGAHMELGDWYVQLGEEQQAWTQYRTAWELAQTDEDQDKDWSSYFDQVYLIHIGPELKAESLAFGGILRKEVYYDFEFDVLPNGRPDDIDILGSNLHGQTRSLAIASFEYARFRPRIVDGIAVTTQRYRVRRVFQPPLPTASSSGLVGAR